MKYVPQNYIKSGDRLSPLPVLVLPAADRVLQTDQPCGIGSLLAFILDEPLHHGSVTAHLAEQIIK